MFLDISKAFDKVWHDGLVLKLKTYGITGPLLLLIESYLSCRQQRVILNGKSSDWSFRQQEFLKLYVRPYLDYGDIIYHKFDPELILKFTKKLETVQYSAALAVSGACVNSTKNLVGIPLSQKTVQTFNTFLQT